MIDPTVLSEVSQQLEKQILRRYARGGKALIKTNEIHVSPKGYLRVSLIDATGTRYGAFLRYRSSRWSIERRSGQGVTNHPIPVDTSNR